MLTNILTLIPVALIPCLVLLVLVYRLDRYAPEKPVWILVALALGAVSFFPSMAVGALVSRGALGEPNLVTAGVRNLAIVAPLEELLKFSVLLGFAYHRKFFDEPLDCMIYAWTIALGFAACENVVYITQASDAFLLRALFSTPSHPLFAGLWGWALGNWRYGNRGPAGLAIVVAMLAQAILAHGLYNFFWELGSIPPHLMPMGLQIPPAAIIATNSVLLALLVVVNFLYYRKVLFASPYRFSMLPKGVRTMRRDMVSYTWRRWIHALWMVVLGIGDVGIVAVGLALASLAYALFAGTTGVTALGQCEVNHSTGLLLAGVAFLVVLALGFAFSGLVYGRFSRARSSALTLLTPGVAGFLAVMLFVGLAPKWLGMWLSGFSSTEIHPPCALTFRKHAHSFLLYSSYIIVGLGFAGGFAGRTWRKAHKKRLNIAARDLQEPKTNPVESATGGAGAGASSTVNSEKSKEEG